MQSAPIARPRNWSWLTAAVCLALLWIPQQRASAEVTLSALSRLDDATVSVSFGRMMFNRRTGEQRVTATLTNLSPSDLGVDTLFLSVENVTNGVPLSNQDASSADPTPIPYFILDTREFGPGGQLTQELVFANLARKRFTFDTGVYVGADTPSCPLSCDDGNPSTKDVCDTGAGGCVNLPVVTAESQSVSTVGTASLALTLRGNSVEGDDLVFAILAGPSAGSASAPVPVVADGVCSDLAGTGTVTVCTSDAQCPVGELCGLPPINSATVTYTPGAADVADSFDFKASLASDPAFFATATVSISADDPSPPPDLPVDNVVANDVSAETVSGVPTIVTLTADAPCIGECDAAEDNPLTFTILTPPANGTLSALTQGTGVPQRTATVTYTPSDTFVGTDSFGFDACPGTETTTPPCDTGTATVVTVAQAPLVTDQTITTESNQPVTINIGKVQALVLRGAQIAGNVADANGDGLGDNHNALPGAAPLLMSAKVNATGGPGSNGVARIQIEWDISGLQSIVDQLTTARVLLTTNRGTIDDSDTLFYVGDPLGANEDGLLTDDDFQMPLWQLDLNGFSSDVLVATMPVDPDVAVGSDGGFEFDVLDAIKAAMAENKTFFAVQGRPEPVFGTCTGQVPFGCATNAQCPVGESCLLPSTRGLQVYTTASGNLPTGLEPQLEIETAGPLGLAVYSIAALPGNGTLFDSQGNPVVVGKALPSTLVTYVPGPGFSGPDSFTAQANNGVGTQGGVIAIDVVQKCVEVGRQPDCAP